jgi:hypothetical protein
MPEAGATHSGPRSQWPLTVVLAIMVVALVVVAADHFRRGSVLFAAAVVLAFFLRLMLPDQDAGWLAVRSRAIDLACLGALGVGLSVFALIVPSPS